MRAPGIRQCAVCGLFYPADASELRQEIRSLLDSVDIPEVQGTILGLVSPHAGYRYSGFTAANGFSLLKDRAYDAVVIVSPSHREYFDGISVYPGDGYSTPLGTVQINEELRTGLLNEFPPVVADVAGHRDEHAVEVQLPFLQEVLTHFSILPIVIGDQRREYCFGLGNALAGLLKGKNALLVASTDLSHYYPGEIASKLDEIMVEDVRSFNPESLMDHLESGRTEACGGGPTVAVMEALRHLGAKSMTILHHCNSGDVTGDYDQVVGYLSAVAVA